MIESRYQWIKINWYIQ